MTELESRVTELVSLILDVPAEQIPTNEAADNLAQWDSLAHLTIIASLEQEFGIQISPDESRKLRSVSKICAFLSKGRGGASAPRSAGS